MDGAFEAMDVDTLDVLWSVNLGSPISAPPMTYSVDTSKLSFSAPAGPAPSGDGYPLTPADSMMAWVTRRWNSR
ncbi:MAG: hypothetical protein JWR51_2504 [Devosia sp.]|nr:hypothetical protein [Devosia sp.]